MACECRLVLALWPLHFTVGSPSCQSKPLLSAVTVEYMQVLLHSWQSGAWQLMKRDGHGEIEKHLFYVHSSEDVCWVPLGQLEDAVSLNFPFVLSVVWPVGHFCAIETSLMHYIIKFLLGS